MALDISLFLLGLNTVGLPTPVSVSDFKNDAYSLNGVVKTYADLFAAPIGHLTLTAGVGLVQDYHGTASASGTAIGTTDLFNMVQPQLGYSGVIDITPTWDPAQQADPSFYAAAGFFAHPSPVTENLSFEIEVFPDVQHGQAFSTGVQANTAANALLNNAPNRIAFTATPTLLAISINGGPVVTTVNSGDYHLLSSVGIFVFQLAGSGFKTVFQKLKLYQPSVASAQLPVLSA